MTYGDLVDRVGERRDDVLRFDEFLRSETSWLTAPASTRFHLACEGGLVEHSANVARKLLGLRGLLAPHVPEESCVIAGLYHDVGKVGCPSNPYYLRGQGSYRVNPDLVHLDVPTRSLFLTCSYVKLTEEEAQAIRYHDGQYIPENRSVAHRETDLTRLLQYADNWCGGKEPRRCLVGRDVIESTLLTKEQQ